MNDIKILNRAIIVPAMYKKVPRIRCTGSQWIDTKIAPRRDTEMHLNFQATANITMFAAGCRQAYGQYAFSLADNWQFNEGMLFQFGSSSFRVPLVPQYEKMECILRLQNSMINGMPIGATFYWSGNKDFSIYIGGCNQGGQIEGRNLQGWLYPSGIFHEGEMHWFDTVEYKGELGLWDVYNDTFKPNEGTGVFYTD